MFKPSQALINGKISDNISGQCVSIFSPSFQYGLTIFEGIRAYNTSKGMKPFLVEEHIKRLVRSWKLLGLGDIPEEKIVGDDINFLLTLLEKKENIYIKYIVGYLGNGTWSTFSKPDRICFFYPSQSIFESNKIRKSKASISSIKRINSNSLAANIKCGANYINSRLSLMDVQKKNEDKILPIMLNDSGMIAESSGATLFLIKNNDVITPNLSSDILKSITRQHILKNLACKLPSLRFLEKDIFRWDLFDADSVFLVGTSAEIIEITEIDFFTFQPDNEVLNMIFEEFKKSIFN